MPRQPSLRFGKPLQFLPEYGGVAQTIERDFAQPAMIFGQHKWAAPLFQSVAVPFQNRVACFPRVNAEVLLRGGRVSAGGEAHKVHAVRHCVHFVKIIDTPDESAFRVPPGPEIFKVQIAHSQQRRRIRGLSGNLAPNLDPPVKRRAQKRKKSRSSSAYACTKARDDPKGCRRPPTFHNSWSLGECSFDARTSRPSVHCECIR